MRIKLLEDVITLFIVINPIGLVPPFISIVFIALGQIVLEGLKVRGHAFRVAGGLGSR